MDRITLDKTRGTTLIESLFVLVGVGMLVLMLLNYTIQRAQNNRIERAAQQMQMILLAAQTFYADNITLPLPGSAAATATPAAWPSPWPSSIPPSPSFPWPTMDMLLNNPPGRNIKGLPYILPMQNPFDGTPYKVAVSANRNVFYVYFNIASARPNKARLIAQAIAGKLPLGYTGKTSGVAPPPQVICPNNGTSCAVVGEIGIPSQVLDNIGQITYAGIFHHGGCVPVVSCPVSMVGGVAMTPQIMVIPVSVSGVSDYNSPNIYPISSYTGYATGGPTLGVGVEPAKCTNTTAYTYPSPNPCSALLPPGYKYWRACLQVVTEKGDVRITSKPLPIGSGSAALSWGKNVTLLVIQRCTKGLGQNEPSASTFSVFSD